MKQATVREVAATMKCCPQFVRLLCGQGRIQGAERRGNGVQWFWVIPVSERTRLPVFIGYPGKPGRRKVAR